VGFSVPLSSNSLLWFKILTQAMVIFDFYLLGGALILCYTTHLSVTDECSIKLVTVGTTNQNNISLLAILDALISPLVG